MPRRFFYFLLGILAGFWIPVCWLFWRAFSARRDWWTSWLKKEFNHHYDVYLVMAIFAVGCLALLGYAIGRVEDDTEKEANTIRDSNLALSQLATTDPLTGLFNSRYIHERLDIEIEDSYRSSMSCLLIDLDHFKKINDTYGHPFGDQVLVTTAEVLKKAVRKLDAVGRLGGEEFIVVLPHTPLESAAVVAERIRQAIESEVFESEARKVIVTASVGLVSFPSEGLHNKEQMMKAVDQALYTAKRKGRNRVVSYSADESQDAA